MFLDSDAEAAGRSAADVKASQRPGSFFAINFIEASADRSLSELAEPRRVGDLSSPCIVYLEIGGLGIVIQAMKRDCVRRG